MQTHSGQPVDSTNECADASATVEDPFLQGLRRLIERGIMAQMPGSALKSLIISRIRSYANELPLSDGQAPDFFVDLCKRMMAGELARMPDEVLKVYLAVMTYVCTPDREKLCDMEAMKEMTGITDASRLREAMHQLEQDNDIQFGNTTNGREHEPQAGSANQEQLRLFHF